MIGYANFRLWVPGGQVPRGWRGGGGYGDKRKDDRSFLPSFMWCHQESNRGHKDFQSFALPTELWHLALDCECKVIAFCRIHQIFSQLFFKNFNNWRKFAVHGAVDATGAYLRHAILDISAIPAQIRKCRVVMNRGTPPGCSHLQPNIPGEVVARLRTTSGVRFCWGISFPACRHAPAWRNTGLRTAAIPCRGLRLPRLSHALPRSLRCSPALLPALPRSLRRSHAPLHCAAAPMHRSTVLSLTCTAPLRCLEACAAARGRKKGVHGGTP